MYSKTNGSVSKPCTPVVHIKIAGLTWMFIPLRMVFFIGIDPYPNDPLKFVERGFRSNLTFSDEDLDLREVANYLTWTSPEVTTTRLMDGGRKARKNTREGKKGLMDGVHDGLSCEKAG